MYKTRNDEDLFISHRPRGLRQMLRVMAEYVTPVDGDAGKVWKRWDRPSVRPRRRGFFKRRRRTRVYRPAVLAPNNAGVRRAAAPPRSATPPPPRRDCCPILYLDARRPIGHRTPRILFQAILHGR